jgi:hypothetical protein
MMLSIGMFRYNIDPLDISAVNVHAPSELRDVNIYDADYGDVSWAGRWYCAFMNWSNCSAGIVQIDLVNGSPPQGNYAKHLLCQELGHALGLDHTSSTSCMNQSATTITGYSDHDEFILDSKY